MKTTIRVILSLFVLVIFSKFTIANTITDQIVLAFKAGNAETLSSYFNSSVELIILDKEAVYSVQQAEQIIKNFFHKYPPVDFVIIFEGGKENSRYAIGTLTTASEKFRVYFLFKPENNKSYIHQLRIEKESNEVE